MKKIFIKEVVVKLKEIDIKEFINSKNKVYNGYMRRNRDGKLFYDNLEEKDFPPNLGMYQVWKNEINFSSIGFNEFNKCQQILNSACMWSKLQITVYSLHSAYKAFLQENWKSLGFDSIAQATWFAYNYLPEYLIWKNKGDGYYVWKIT